jgi:hypothetical protein
MTIFALVVKAFQDVGQLWKTPRFTDALERQWHDDDLWQSCYEHWGKLTAGAIDFVYPIYKKQAAGYLKKEGEELTLANFFKNVGYVNKLMQRPLALCATEPAGYCVRRRRGERPYDSGLRELRSLQCGHILPSGQTSIIHRYRRLYK